MPLTLQFVASASLDSRVVQVFERGWASHVDAVLPSGELLGALPSGGVQIRPSGYAKWTRVERFSLVASSEVESAWLEFLHAQVGKPYDELAIAAFAVQRNWREPDAWFCSELQAAALEHCGWAPHRIGIGVNEITPRDLLMVVSPWATSLI